MFKLVNVSKYYNTDGNVALGLKKVNVELFQNEIVAIVGESGSGKTTFLNVISGVDTYEEDEKDKCKIVPGLTGYCQAYFRNSATVREKRLKDAWYANNVSFALDVKIFLKTIQTVLKHENLYTN